MLDSTRLQFDIAALVLREPSGKITITETEYEGVAGKVIACTVNPEERSTSYFLEDYDEAKHAGSISGEGQGTIIEEVTDEEVMFDDATDDAQDIHNHDPASEVA